jgi:hypothetical protein
VNSSWPDPVVGTTSASVPKLSPTSFEAMRDCPLRVALGHELGRLRSPRAPIAALGIVCHQVLRVLVESGAILEARWQTALDDAWATELPSHNHLREAPGYTLKYARVVSVARRVRDLLINTPEAVWVTETELTSKDGMLHGWPDLVIRGRDATTVVDYKSGRVVEEGQHDLRPSYQRQLQFYAYLEAESTGRWPSRALVLPFDGPAWEIVIDEAECLHLANGARAELLRYNERVPHAQPDSAGPATCRQCRWACSCPAFWRQCDASWETSLLAARGTVVELAVSQLGAVTFVVSVRDGTVTQESITIRAVDPRMHPVARSIVVGADIALVALRFEVDRGTYSAPPWARIVVAERDGLANQLET